MDGQENIMENMNYTHDFKSKKDFFKILTLFILIMSIFMIFKIVGVYKEIGFIGQNKVNTMSFSGQGEVFAVADIAVFNFSVTEKASTITKAQEMSAEKINAILAYLKSQNIKEKDIKTINYNVYPRYEWANKHCTPWSCPKGERTIVGYEVSQSITVKVRDTDKAGIILSGVGKLGATNISGLNFSVSDVASLKRDARKLAISDAKNKAKELSQDLGVNLVRIVSFNESGVYPMYRADAVYETKAMGGVAETPKIPLGKNKITSNITITYQIK